MRSFYDCIPCFLNQALASARSITNDDAIHGKVLRSVLKIVLEMDMHNSPPAMAQKIHRIIREITGEPDPYKDDKLRYNTFALSLLPELREKLKHSNDPFDTALRLSIAGNIIDFGKDSNIKHKDVMQSIANTFIMRIDSDAVRELRRRVKAAKNILYLGDNAGEIVFDRLLIEHMPYKKITYIVRGNPVINDATIEDAVQIGMNDLVDVFDNGSDAPGTILSDCSVEFQNRFSSADLVIAKGQGNYETLSDVDDKIFFLLQAKCHVIARDIGCQIGDFIIARKKAS